jgi:hypothetical protein
MASASSHKVICRTVTCWTNKWHHLLVRVAGKFPVTGAIEKLIYAIFQGLNGGAGGIRTLGTSLSSYAGLANQCLQPLGHSSIASCLEILWH